MKQERFRLTKLEKDWVLYDIGNSAFILLVATLLPIYFNYLSESSGLSSVDYLAYWGYTTSAVTLIVALTG
ncbi:MAG: MFS transporter, partial [Butyricicoccaceae bacterium]